MLTGGLGSGMNGSSPIVSAEGGKSSGRCSGGTCDQCFAVDFDANLKAQKSSAKIAFFDRERLRAYAIWAF